MNDLFTPRQVARAIHVSESSVKRWCDKGMIATQYTAGGHRRILLGDLLKFLRNGQIDLVNPEILGLPVTSRKTPRTLSQASAQLAEALLVGEEYLCRQLTMELFLAEHSLSVICDEVFATAFRTVGDCWADGSAEIYQERRASEIAMRLLHELRSLLPGLPTDAPVAVGGTVSGDHYTLGTTMAELVLRDAKWKAVSLGDHLPFCTIAAAIKEQRPQLFWLSCSHIEDAAAFLEGYQELYEEFGFDVAFVVGGFALSEELRQQMKFSAHCDNFQHLAGFAQTLMGAMQREGEK
ncbi:MAG: MerR family transcriptional regulator [Bythopirellula sp.]